MELHWSISEGDVAAVVSIVERMSANPFVMRRISDNLEARGKVNRAELWHCMVSTRLTSAQRSGPESPVTMFVNARPFALNYEATRAATRPAEAIAAALRAHGGIRFADRIGRDLEANLATLEAGGWSTTLDVCNGLIGCDDRGGEKLAASHIDEFVGFGSKQARNLLQQLGLIKYEIPIDSRLSAWLRDFGFPVPLSAPALGDPAFYQFVLDVIVELCARAGVYPCVFDAAVFASRDEDGWTEGNATN
jgi:hypothetical protein